MAERHRGSERDRPLCRLHGLSFGAVLFFSTRGKRARPEILMEALSRMRLGVIRIEPDCLLQMLNPATHPFVAVISLGRAGSKEIVLRLGVLRSSQRLDCASTFA